MKYLTIRFVSAPGILTEAIDWATNSLIAHTEGLSRDGKSWVGAHSGTGIDRRPLDWCEPKWERQYRIAVADEEYEAAMAYMESMIGTPYNYADIFGLALHNRHLNSAHHIICSAFMFNWFLKGGIQALNVLPEFSYLVTPETLHLAPVLIGNCIYHFPQEKL